MEISSRQTILSSSVLTLALVSDAVLYLLLPIFFEDFLLTIVWVGILLSANRFLRIFLNPVIVKVYNDLGVKKAVILAVLLATVGCSLFLFPLGVWFLLLARFLWGFAYGLLRLACLFSATSDAKYSLKNMGWYGAILEVGPLLVLMAAPWLNHWYSPKAIIAISLGLCVVAFVPALLLDDEKPEKNNKTKRVWFPQFDYHSFLTFVFCLLFDAIWIIVLAPLLISSGMNQQQALAASAMLIIIKRGSNLLLGLAVVRFSQFRHANIGLHLVNIAMILAAMLLASGSIFSASILGIIGHGLFMILMPKILSDKYHDSALRKASLNDFTLYRDFAAALGALSAGLLLTMDWVTQFYFLMAVLIAVVLAFRGYKGLAHN